MIFLLSCAAGLRAKEIAELELFMVTNSQGEVGEVIALQDKASKGNSGRIIPMKPILKEAILNYLKVRKHSESPFLITTERSQKFSANAVAVFFKRLYDKLGFVGASSHSGRRSFITACARKLSLAEGSLKDLMALSGHKNQSSLQLYIAGDSDIQKKIVGSIFSI